MTLFRKVFLNQARPASPTEALDETALREAFREMSGSMEPLILDPFARVTPAGPEETATPKPEAQAEDESGSDAASDTSLADFADEALDAKAPDDFTEEADDAEATVEGISAALQQAMDHESDTAEADDMTTEDDLERETAKDDEAAEEGLAAMDEECAPEQTSAHETPNERTEPEAQPQEAETFDLAAFAQRQMQALNAGASPLPKREDNAPEDLEGAVLDDMPAPAAGRVGRRAGRVKTRLLGFNRADMQDNDPFGSAAETTATAQREKFPVGWLVVVEGPGIGHSFSLFTGASVIGRGEDQVIRLDFGDNSISRQNHAAIAYDEEQNKFYLGHGGKSNIIRRNARPVLSTEELNHADLIRIGETTLRFVALCGSDFQWDMMDGSNAAGL